MLFYRAHVILRYDHCLNRQALGDEVKELDFIYVSSLDSQTHIDLITYKALRVIGFNRQHYSNFASHILCLSPLYNALVRSLFEYDAVI